MYSVSITAAEAATAGSRVLRAGLALQGGLAATYYVGANLTWGDIDPFAEPAEKFPAATSQPAATVDFSGAPGTPWPAAPSCLVGPFPFAARWHGLFKQTSGGAQTYTFEAPVKVNLRGPVSACVQGPI